MGGDHRSGRPTLSKVHSIGVDIGGTAIKAALVGTAGQVLQSAQAPTTPEHPDHIVKTVVDLVHNLSTGNDIKRVGVAVAAFLSKDRELIELSPNIAWTNRPLRQELSEALNMKVVVENDANAAGWAEFVLGAGQGSQSMVMFTLGTGVGGAVIEAGKLVIGARGQAAELGHIIVDPDGELCGCGQRGCLEAVASATAAVKRLRAETGDETLTTQTLETWLGARSDIREQFFKRAADALARAILTVHSVLDPELVVIGGGMVDKTGGAIVELTSSELRRLNTGRRSTVLPTIRPATLGNAAGVVGAALLAEGASS